MMTDDGEVLVALWIVNCLLALAFLAAGGTKLVRDADGLRSVGMAWVDDFPAAVPKVIGALEVLGAIGLILPLATGIAPLLTPIAAVALGTLMLGAIGVHIRRRESFAPSLVLFVFAVASAILGFVVVLRG
jgi:uncharacterized membrane protein YphA (DoxX/SURF4 family)